ncbi:hypothetical protein HOLleu_23072 [Holothuria leucospilota]|uniref:Fibrinogen C-terminal domain-containing protein n=1 Tax=Holothuria leucospilota TaxID=206669 RepID=A0A9Q1BU99_HOLLE|nr:hypothetical protein HOLleu_23072 [Holothuria leucospilota]
MTGLKNYQLRVDLAVPGGTQYHALYANFSINDEDDNYRISHDSYSGTAGLFHTIIII